MNLTIVASQPLKKQTLEVHGTGISYNESPGFGMGEWTHVSFAEIDAVLRSTTGTVLSILAGRAVYKIQFNDRNPGHHEVIDRIVKGAVQSVADRPVPPGDHHRDTETQSGTEEVKDK